MEMIFKITDYLLSVNSQFLFFLHNKVSQHTEPEPSTKVPDNGQTGNRSVSTQCSAGKYKSSLNYYLHNYPFSKFLDSVDKPVNQYGKLALSPPSRQTQILFCLYRLICLPCLEKRQFPMAKVLFTSRMLHTHLWRENVKLCIPCMNGKSLTLFQFSSQSPRLAKTPNSPNAVNRSIVFFFN